MKKNMYTKDDKGSVLLPALMIMMLLTIMGFSIAATTTMGLKVAVNKKYHKTAFISAESGLSYLMNTISLYGTDASANIDKTNYFPEAGDSNTVTINEDNEDQVFYLLSSSNSQLFRGEVRYTGSRMVPRGSGSEAGMFRAHDYQAHVVGKGPANSESIINSVFYRIGF